MNAKVIDQVPEGAIEIRMTPGDLLPGVDVSPLVRRVWHGSEAQSKWTERWKLAASLHHRVEYEMVRRGHRKAATLHLSGRDFDVQLDRIQQDGLVWLPIQRTRAYNGFSHRHFPTSADDPNSSVYGVLACDMEAAKLFRSASQNPVDHRVIGDLLGFPPCCHAFFVDVWAQGFYDPIWQAAERTPGIEYPKARHAIVKGSVLCAQTLRYAGFRVTSHLPCSMQCEPSKEIGRIWWQTGIEVDADASMALLRILGMKQTWSVCHGVAVIETPVFTIWTNSIPTAATWTIDYTPADVGELAASLTDSK